MVLICIFLINQTSESDSTLFKLDSVYYRYQVVQDTVFHESLYVPISLDTIRHENEGLRISGVKDFSFDVDQGFDQGLKVAITGEVEGVSVEGNLSDQTIPSSTVRISDIEKMSLKIFTKNFYGGIGDLTLDLPFGIQDEIQGARIGFHSIEQKNKINLSYAMNRGSFKRMQFAGEEGKQSPYFLSGPALVGSERVYLAQGIAQSVLLKRDEDYNIDYESGIISFTNKNIITNRSRIEVEYQEALQNYENIYQETDGQTKIGDLVLAGMYRRKYDDRDDPLTFTLNPPEIDSLSAAGDSSIVLHTYADTSSQGNYIIENNHFVFAGEGNGNYNVTFFYVGERQGEYIYDPNIKGFSYQGPGLGNYTSTKYIPLPQKNDFYASSVSIFEAIRIEAYGSNFDKNTFSSINDNDNFGKGGRIMLEKASSKFSFHGEYIYYDENLFMPAGKEDIDYQYQWQTQDPMKELGDIAINIMPIDFLKFDLGYGLLNRKHKRISVNLQPLFFQFGYEGIDSLDKYYTGIAKDLGRFSFTSRYENYEKSHLFNYRIKYAVRNNNAVSISGSYDKDTTSRGVTTVFDLSTSPLSLSLGHRLYNDTTFLFGNATISILFQGVALIGVLQQSQRYSQKRDETYAKVEEGEGNYVYDPVTNTYIESENGDYVKKVFLLDEFERVVTRSYCLETRYTKSNFDGQGKFNYVNEKNLFSHNEDFSFSISDDIYNLECNVRQDMTEDARYALFTSSSRERLFSLVPLYKKLLGRIDIKEEIAKYNDIEGEKRNGYSIEVGYNIISNPLLRPRIGYSYSKIFSQYFENLDILLQTPKIHLLFGLPIIKTQGRLELTGELTYRIYNIDQVPYFFSANDPPGLTKIIGTTVNIGIGNNTILSLIYKAEFPPQDELRQNLRFQTRIKF